jgi:hypothetical protein
MPGKQHPINLSHSEGGLFLFAKTFLRHLHPYKHFPFCWYISDGSHTSYELPEGNLLERMLRIRPEGLAGNRASDKSAVA